MTPCHLLVTDVSEERTAFFIGIYADLVGYLRRRRCCVGCRFHFAQALWGVGDREGRSMTLSNHRDVNTDNFPQPFVELAEYL